MSDLAAVHLRKYLNSRKDNNESLFVNRFGNRLSKHAIEEDMRKLGKRTEIKGCHPHRFRVTLATEMYKKGIDVHTIQTILGHEDVNMTIRYIRANNEVAKNKYEAVMR